MSDLKTPEKIYSDIVNNELSLNDGITSLISLIQLSENNEAILKAKENLNKLSKSYKETFQILKLILEIDEKAINRLIVAIEMLNIFGVTCENLLANHIEKDNSALFLTELFNFLRTYNSRSTEILRNSLIRKYSRIYEVISNEAIFFIDLESTQINSKKDLDFRSGYFKKFTAPDIKTLRKVKQYNYVIKNNHVKALDLSRWEFHELPESIGLLSELEYLNLVNLKLKHLPESMDHLFKLKYLNLNGNNLTILPIWLIEFSNKKLTEKYIKEGVLQTDVTVLGLLEVLSGEKLEKAQQNDDVLTWEIVLHYKINGKGNIKGIYLRSEKSDIGIFPEQICSLEFLEELEIPGSSIEEIPLCIGNLQSLKFLNLSFNQISIIPDSINRLKNLEHLNLIENNMSERAIKAIIWNKKGETFLDNGEYEKVIEECTTTLKVYPKHKFALFHLGIAYSEMGELIKAKQAYKEFLKIDPLSSVVWSSLSDVYHQEGKFEKAILSIRKALAIEPDVALLWSNLGFNYKKVGKNNDAIDSYLHSLELYPKNKNIWEDVASIYRDHGEIMKAIEADERALEIELNPEDL